jgi:hypothetical protein
MSTSEARYVATGELGDAGVTATAAQHRSEPPGYPFGKFWKEYYSRLDRKLEAEIKPLLENFLQFRDGWDSYNARPLRADTASFALTVLNSIMELQTPLPHVAPSAAGGVHIEWHEKGVDLELDISAPYACYVWFCDHRAEVAGEDVHLTNDFSALRTPITLLTNR